MCVSVLMRVYCTFHFITVQPELAKYIINVTILVMVTVQFILQINSLPVTVFSPKLNRNGSRLDFGGSKEATWSRRRPREAQI